MATENEGGDGGTGGGAGGVADLLGTPPAGGDGGAGGGDGGGGDGGAGGGDGGDGTADPAWYASLSAEGGDADNPSHRDWVKSAGIKDVDGLAKVARDNMRALRESGRIKVPGEGAKPEEIAEFNKAIGVPDDATGYSIAAPKGADGEDLPLDADLVGRLAESAFKHGAPKAVFEGIAGDFIQMQLDDAAKFDAEQKAAADALVKSWGAGATEKLAAIDRAAKALGITRDEMVAARNAWGAEALMNRLVKLGEGMAEDVMINGGQGKFGVSGAEAQAELTRLKADKEFTAKLMSGDVTAKARWDRLIGAVAAWEDAKAKAA